MRQLCWRDFHHQVLAARPETSAEDYRARGDRWRGEDEAAGDIAAWREGRTGYPVVDAAMRQLRHEGWMHNRARLLAASFLTKTLYVDWRIGARHFLHLLVDGDVADNQLNWQWVAGTGTDTRPHRVLNPVLQGRRFDPRASTCAAGCRSCGRWPAPVSTSPGGCRRRSGPGRATRRRCSTSPTDWPGSGGRAAGTDAPASGRDRRTGVRPAG